MPRARSSNRTDLPGKVPTTVTAPGQAYGKQTSQAQSMKIQPVAAPAGPTPGSQPSNASPTATPTGQPGAAPNLAAILGGGGSRPAGSLLFDHPTQRPNVPVTNGLPTGPGPGPEALTGFAAQGAQALADGGSVKGLLSTLASQPGSSSLVKQLAATAR